MVDDKPTDENQSRKAELQAVPIWRPNKAKWPNTIRSVGIDELDNLGVDRVGNLFWDGKPIEVRRLLLTRGQRIAAISIALIGFFAALGTVVQGSVAAHSWLCQLMWLDQSWCPSL
ncbi:MAG: hypothetical protein Rhirs2KO_27570 [Rhizobiaceae bacterium]